MADTTHHGGSRSTPSPKVSSPKNARSSELVAMALTHANRVNQFAPGSNKATTNNQFLSSIFYNLGNISCIISGIQRGRHNPGGRFTQNDLAELGVGISFSIGDVLMSWVSRDNPSETEKLETGLKDHLRRHHIKLPEPDGLNADSIHRSGAYGATYDFVKRNIVSIKCLTEGTAGLLMINAATKKGNLNRGKLVAGLLVSTGWFSTLLLNHLTPPDNTDNLVDKIRDNPKGWIARPAAIGNNIANFIGSMDERKRFKGEVHAAEEALRNATAEEISAAAETLRIASNKQHDYIWNTISACSFLMANYLFGISSKGSKPATSAEEQAIADELVNMSASTLAGLPMGLRDKAVQQAANYTAAHVGNTLGKDAIAKAIHDQIALMHSNKSLPQIALASIPAPGTTLG